MLEKRQHVEGYGAVQVDLYSRKPDAASDAVFPPLGYAAAALKSYLTFEKLLADGKIPSGTRLMLALPPPFAPMTYFIQAGKRGREAWCATVRYMGGDSVVAG